MQHDILRPAAARQEPEFVLHQQLREKNLNDRTGKKPARARRLADSKVQHRGFGRGEQVLVIARVDGRALLAEMIRAIAVKVGWVRGVAGVVLDRECGHADVCPLRHVDPVGEGVGLPKQSSHPHGRWWRQPLRLAHYAVEFLQMLIGSGGPPFLCFADGGDLVAQAVQVLWVCDQVVQNVDHAQGRRVHRRESEEDFHVRQGLEVSVGALGGFREPGKSVVVFFAIGFPCARVVFIEEVADLGAEKGLAGANVLTGLPVRRYQIA